MFRTPGWAWENQPQKASGGSPTEGKAPKGPAMARDAVEGKPSAAPRGPEYAHSCVEGGGTSQSLGEGRGTRSPSYHQSHLSHPTARRGPTLARCEPPVGTEFIFLTSCDNTWLCLFNFLLWMGQENQFGSLRSKHSSPHITRGHPHRRRSPAPPESLHLAHGWQGPASGPWDRPGLLLVGPGFSWALSQSLHRAWGPRGGCRWHRCGSRGGEAKFTPTSPAPRT